ncbi:hypothetical protein DS742_28000 [Lacrimispora amygdalina]|uniref:Uncharacterized protein n=1 Tax=Lacrimispora amygdalina TaxID=253257 RepID=A0A3E2N3N6_9FIRM|nr:hypothetical protein [Clostridium indicum]RFZ75620.1 hypothetical protein DS742_28000 [Clostridium indicum]
MSVAQMETTKIEIMLPQTCKHEADEFAEFFQSMTVEERMDFLKTVRGAKLYQGIMKSQRAG